MGTTRLLAAIVGSAMALTIAGGVFADTPLLETPISADDPLYLADCTDEELALLDDAGASVAWLFLLQEPAGFVGQLWARFTDPADEQTVDQFEVNDDGMYFYILNDSVTLGDSDATNDPDATTLGVSGARLRLSHVCIAPAPTPTPTLPPTSTVPTTPASPSGTSMNLVLGLILLIAGGITAYAMRPRRSTR
jgi:hypothetical protein